jgi:REP element-mobilizing transposase RayT
MQVIDEFTYGYNYHVYNRGVNGCNIFLEDENYNYFINLYAKYLAPIVETYAWVMMPNHFHFALRVKTKKEIQIIEQEKDILCLKKNNFKLGKPHQQFSNFLNAYAQAFNRKYERKGNLFEKRFKRKIIREDDYFRTIILYVHNNPVNHGFCKEPEQYSWSSYQNYISLDPERSEKNEVIKWFDNLGNFIQQHKNFTNVQALDQSLEN